MRGVLGWGEGLVLVALVVVPIGAWVRSARRRGRRAVDAAWLAFASAHGWTYLPRAPLRDDFRLLEGGVAQDTGRGIVLEVDGRRWTLYEHVRIDDAGDTGTTRYVVLVVEGVRPRADGMRIRARAGYDLIPGPRMRRFELESVELDDRFVVEVPVSMPEERVREVLTPTAIVDLLALANADSYLGEYAELQVDSLLLASHGTIGPGDGPYVEATVGVAAPVVARLGAP